MTAMRVGKATMPVAADQRQGSIGAFILLMTRFECRQCAHPPLHPAGVRIVYGRVLNVESRLQPTAICVSDRYEDLAWISTLPPPLEPLSRSGTA